MFALSFALFSTALELTAKEIDEGDSRALNYQTRMCPGKQKNQDYIPEASRWKQLTAYSLWF